jgi:hypothetical protein
LLSIPLNKNQRDLFNSEVCGLMADRIPKGLLAQFRVEGKQVFVDAFVISDEQVKDIKEVVKKVLHEEEGNCEY